jgi:hypothetical protein
MVLYRRLFDHTGLPRSRITDLKSGYDIIHGNRAPLVDDWLELVKERFRLTEVTLLYTEHERMLGDDPLAVQDVLEMNLDLTDPEIPSR